MTAEDYELRQQARIETLEALLLESKLSHKHCDDCWYCCPKCDHADHWSYPSAGFYRKDNGAREAACCCGADQWNAKVDAAIATAEAR